MGFTTNSTARGFHLPRSFRYTNSDFIKRLIGLILEFNSVDV